MKKLSVRLAAGLLGATMFLSVGLGMTGEAYAASLTSAQIQSILSLLQAFGANQTTISNVSAVLTGQGTVTVNSGSTGTSTTTASTTPSGNPGELTRSLHLGDEGKDVKILQALLAQDPSIYPQGVISGIFGSLTQQAVEKFQKEKGLEQVGSVGPRTLALLEEMLQNSPLSFQISTSTGTTTITLSFPNLPPTSMSSSTGEEGNDQGNNNNEGDNSDFENFMPCAIVPLGHFIAPGWLKHHEGDERPIVPPCQMPPPGTTTPPVVVLPMISNVSVSGLATTSSTISWTTNVATNAQVYFGTSTPFSLGTAMTTGTSVLSTLHSQILSNLMPNTTYTYVLQSTDGLNNTTTTSPATFTTLAVVVLPVISTVSISGLSSTTATLSWATNVATNSKVYFGTSTPFVLSSAMSVSSNTFSTSHMLTITGLTASTTYTYVVQSVDGLNNTATTSPAIFLTTMN